MDEQSVIGIDGGGSKTEFVWVRRDGQVLSTARKRGSNYQDVGIDGLNGLLEEVLSPWLTSANREGPACICLGLAGAGRPDEQRTIVESLLEKGSGAITTYCTCHPRRTLGKSLGLEKNQREEGALDTLKNRHL